MLNRILIVLLSAMGSSKGDLSFWRETFGLIGLKSFEILLYPGGHTLYGTASPKSDSPTFSYRGKNHFKEEPF